MSDEKKQKTEIAEAVAQAIKEALPAAVAVATKIMNPTVTPPAPPEFIAGQECNVCGQKNMACRNKHVKMVVYPQSGKHGKWFQGVWINGKRYLSNNRSHYISVPEENDIANVLETWEHQEEVQANGRTIEHDSGSVGPGGRFNKADYPGFGSR